MDKFYCLTIVAILLIIRSDQSNCTRCFCSSKQPRCHNPVCESEWCLVGFKNRIDLIQECANSSVDRITGCTADYQDWQEVCSCRVDFCNTFAFLREYTTRSKQTGERSMDKRTKFQAKLAKPETVDNDAFDYSSNNKFEKIFNQKFTNSPLSTNPDFYVDDDDNQKRVSVNNDASSEDFWERKEAFNRKNRRHDVLRHYKINLSRTQQLTVLLIILPLVLGTATVLVIFVNYHCKMCS